MQEEDEFREAVFPLLDRIVKAGWATGWSCNGTRLSVQWTPPSGSFDGGEDRFLLLVELLRELSPDHAISEQDQAMLLCLENGLLEGEV